MKLKFIGILLGVLLLSACTIQTPFTVVEDWLMAVDARDGDRLSVMMVDEQMQEMHPSEILSYLNDVDEQCGEIKGFTVKNFNRLDDPVLKIYGVNEGNMVFYNLECGDVGRIERRVDIVKVDGEWKVVNN